MEINRNNILAICKDNHITPDKDYGQNFLIDPSTSSRIVSLLDIKKGERVLEIGPGLGSLTHFLFETSPLIDVIDVDYNMVGFLEMHYQGLKTILGDVREYDVGQYEKIIGNLPYNITTEIIIHLLLNTKKAKRLVLMCQAEAFNHFFDTKGSEYGPVSVLLHLIADIKKNFNVGKGSFYPIPKVESVVFTIDFNDFDRELAKKVFSLCKSLFLNRRKTILNNLGRYMGDKDKAGVVLKEVGILDNKRPEEITPHQYLLIYKNVKGC